MENKQFPSNKKLLSIQEEKLIREFDYDSAAGASTCFPKKQLLLEILQKGPAFRQSAQQVLVSIKQRAPPIKTLYIAEKSRYHSKRSSDKSGSRLAIGDHSSFTSHFSEDNSNIGNSVTRCSRQQKAYPTSDLDAEKYSSSSSQIKNYINEEVKDNVMRTTSGIGRPGCSYIEQYSHIPETSAFQRYSQQGPPVSANKATNLEKEHNSEQYGRDFTAYDGITARGRRQSASVPCKRDDIPKVAAERVHKIRHKLNPVRDYRLMDTVHYLAQGEFAPRDDGIKLTPSREAVLSDIIWEDVCRTHWPNTRLGRRITHADRYSTRGELQRLIDNLLRERVAHVERRKRRHYRIVKLNNRNENCRPVGKTGDIIVANHKNKQNSRDLIVNDHKTNSAVMADRRRGDKSPRKSHKSYERMIIPGIQPTSPFHHHDCSPGPSYAAYPASNREPTNCYHTSTSNNQRQNIASCSPKDKTQELSSSSSISAYKGATRKPRLVVKKDASRRKFASKEEPNLEHFILLPTLVVRTPSNMKRQKKFNELYHRILNVHINEAQNDSPEADVPGCASNSKPNKKDIGFNINITLSDSEEKLLKK
ncbi:uncharacterized protein [Epargyreus clarus]|uniref:uncharacterized protein isoform X2 n=1 Tax=Epargyreus clarus TaxID=520877 RepID=UPI003C2CFA23